MGSKRVGHDWATHTHTKGNGYTYCLLSTYCVPGAAQNLFCMLNNPPTNPMRTIPTSQVRKWNSLILCDASKITCSQQQGSTCVSVCKAPAFCKSQANHCVLWHLSITHGKYVSFFAVPSLLLDACPLFSSSADQTPYGSLKVESEDFRINFFLIKAPLWNYF